jgi:hypothetical protein
LEVIAEPTLGDGSDYWEWISQEPVSKLLIFETFTLHNSQMTKTQIFVTIDNGDRSVDLRGTRINSHMVTL